MASRAPRAILRATCLRFASSSRSRGRSSLGGHLWTCRGLSSASSSPITVPVITDLTNPALEHLPKIEGVEFIIGEDRGAFEGNSKVESAEMFIFIPPMQSTQTLKHAWESAPNAKWLHSFYTGIDMLSGFCSESLHPGQTLTNAKGAYSASLAEWTITSCLYFNKQITRCQRNRVEKRWDKFEMKTLYNKTIGFVGFGDIAQASAKLAKSFGMRVLALKRNPEPHYLADHMYSVEQRHEMLAESDFVMCSLPGTAETASFMGEEEFNAMSESSVFISMGRGIAVDEDALVKALRSDSIAGAALDVFRVEPLPSTSPLWDCDNVLLTAHNADYAEDYFNLAWKVWRDNFEAYTSGQPLLSTVKDPSQGY